MPTRITDRIHNGLTILGIIVILTGLFTLLLFVTGLDPFQPVAEARGLLQKALAFVGSLPVGMFTACVMAFLAARTLLLQFMQPLYDLSPQEANKLLWRIMVGVYKKPPLDPIMLVDKGRSDPDGPDTLYKVGGPGHLGVSHDTAMLLERGGRITRVVGAGGAGPCRLEAFEKIWDVIDLRPQNRTVQVPANTRDGIPVTCKVETRFRVRRPGDTLDGPMMQPPLEFTEEDQKWVLKLATNKVTLDGSGERKMSDWRIRITNSVIDGEVRDCIENYRTDELFDPIRSGPSMLTIIEDRITPLIREKAWKQGVKIDYVHLVSIMPDVGELSEQWLELWRSKWQIEAAKDKAVAEALPQKAYDIARIKARAELLDALLEPLKKITAEDAKGFSTEVLLEFLHVMQSMAEKDPLVQSTMFQQLESLNLMITQILEGAGDTPPALPKLPPKV